jgi:hypothetical protein
MRSPRAFLSFAFEQNEPERIDFIDQAPKCMTPFTVEDWSPQAGTSRGDAQKRLQGLVGRNDLMIILIGRDAKSCLNLTNEIELAKRTNVPYFGVVLGDADENAELPVGLARNRTIPRDWNRIASAVGQMMTEGKNHTFR